MTTKPTTGPSVQAGIDPIHVMGTQPYRGPAPKSAGSRFQGFVLRMLILVIFVVGAFGAGYAMKLEEGRQDQDDLLRQQEADQDRILSLEQQLAQIQTNREVGNRVELDLTEVFEPIREAVSRIALVRLDEISRQITTELARVVSEEDLQNMAAEIESLGQAEASPEEPAASATDESSPEVFAAPVVAPVTADAEEEASPTAQGQADTSAAPVEAPVADSEEEASPIAQGQADTSLLPAEPDLNREAETRVDPINSSNEPEPIENRVTSVRSPQESAGVVLDGYQYTSDTTLSATARAPSESNSRPLNSTKIQTSPRKSSVQLTGKTAQLIPAFEEFVMSLRANRNVEDSPIGITARLRHTLDLLAADLVDRY